MAAVQVLNATAVSMAGRLSTNAGLLRRMAEQEAVLVDAQAWLYGLHTRLLQAMVAREGWGAIPPSPKHAVNVADDHLLITSGTQGAVTADTLLVVLTPSGALQGMYLRVCL
jgi:putative hemolysin